MGYTGPYDFCGWVTKNNLRCADGRVIRHGAFIVNDGQRVPLVWNHDHGKVSQILGHAILENRDEGVYGYGLFNNTLAGQDAKECVQHGDVKSMSIWANELDQVGTDVIHGNIREVSLVVAGANPGAFIESVLSHGDPADESDIECIIHTGDELILSHSIEDSKGGEKKEDPPTEPDKKEEGKETILSVYNSMSDKQKSAVAAIVAEATAGTKKEDESKTDPPVDNNKNGKEETEMKHNIFESQKQVSTGGVYLSHAVVKQFLDDARKTKISSLREAVEAAMQEGGVLAHSIPTDGMTTATGTQQYGFNDPSMLFPDFKTLNNPPEFLSREMDWVQEVMADVHHTPFSRIKSVYANITEDEARAKGYIKGNQKKTEVFTTLKRTTTPQTVYKLQKLDRDDIIDITDFDVVAWIKAEMRIMLDEEIARAILIGDGRASDAEDKIKEENVRPVATDVALFNTIVHVKVAANATEDDIAKATIRAAIKSRKHYKGSGNPKFWTTEDYVTDMLLLEDQIGHKLYKTEGELATALRVSKITTVEPMEGVMITDNHIEGTPVTLPLIGIIVNLKDYNVGADKGGEVNLFDDFDIDFNQYSYLIETRISGALIKPFSAITLVLEKVGASSASVQKD